MDVLFLQGETTVDIMLTIVPFSGAHDMDTPKRRVKNIVMEADIVALGEQMAKEDRRHFSAQLEWLILQERIRRQSPISDRDREPEEITT